MNQLAIPSAANLPAHLRQYDINTAAAEFSAGVSGGASLPTLSIRGKEFRFRWNGQEQSTRSRSLDCVLVAARPNVSRRWYAEKYSSGSIEAPDCYAVDGLKPDAGCGSPQAASCAACPKGQFGSKITPSGKKGKECSDYKRLVVLPVFDGKLFDSPMVLDVPATSLKASQGYRGQDLFLREYMMMLAKHGVPPVGAVTTMSFTDAEYPQLSFGFNRYTSEQEFAVVNGWREHDDVRDVLETAALEAAGPITPALPPAPAHVAAAPQPAPAPAPQPAFVPPVVVQPAQAPAPAQPSFAPANPAPEPVHAAPAPQVAPAAAVPAPSGDVMESVRNLLKGL